MDGNIYVDTVVKCHPSPSLSQPKYHEFSLSTSDTSTLGTLRNRII